MDITIVHPEHRCDACQGTAAPLYPAPRGNQYQVEVVHACEHLIREWDSYARGVRGALNAVLEDLHDHGTIGPDEFDDDGTAKECAPLVLIRHGFRHAAGVAWNATTLGAAEPEGDDDGATVTLSDGTTAYRGVPVPPDLAEALRGLLSGTEPGDAPS